MPANAKVDWYGNDVLLLVEDALDEIVSKLAFCVEGEAKPDAKVDTGFMRNAIYAITPAGTSAQGDPSGKYRSRKTGQMVQRNRVTSTPEVGQHEAAVHGAAEYTIYREMEDGFLYQALEKAVKQAPGIIREVGRKHFD